MYNISIELLLLRTGDHLLTVSLQACGHSSTPTFVKHHIIKPSDVDVLLLLQGLWLIMTLLSCLHEMMAQQVPDFTLHFLGTSFVPEHCSGLRGELGGLCSFCPQKASYLVTQKNERGARHLQRTAESAWSRFEVKSVQHQSDLASHQGPLRPDPCPGLWDNAPSSSPSSCSFHPGSSWAFPLFSFHGCSSRGFC